MDTLKINYFNQYCCISLPFVNKEYEKLSYEVYSDKGYSCVCNLKNFKNSDNKLHVTFTYNKDECYFLKIILNDKIITTFIKPNNTLEKYRHDNSNIKMNINRDGLYNKELSKNEFIKNIDTLKTEVETKLLEEEAEEPPMNFMELRRQLYNLNKLGGFDSDDEDYEDEDDEDEDEDDDTENNILKKILIDSGIRLTDSMMSDDFIRTEEEDDEEDDEEDEDEEDDGEDDEEDDEEEDDDDKKEIKKLKVET